MATLEQHLPYALRQFETDILIPLTLFGVDVSFTTSSSAKITTVIVVVAFFFVAMRERALIPGRLQSSAELVYEFVARTVTKAAGPAAKQSIPFIFSLFIFIWIGTLLGITPFKDTFTSHLAVTMALSMAVFIYVNVIGFRRNGVGFLRHFLPASLPVFAMPIFLFVEVISYLFRPLTLGFRLFANVVAGHILLKLFSDFCVMFVEASGPLGILASPFPILMMVVLYGFEVVIVSIQSYIFILITSMYLRDSLREH